MVEKGRKSFLINLALYVIFNVSVTIINLIYSPDQLWFYCPIIIWGISGLLPHYLFGVRWIEKRIKEEQQRIEQKAKSWESAS